APEDVRLAQRLQILNQIELGRADQGRQRLDVEGLGQRRRRRQRRKPLRTGLPAVSGQSLDQIRAEHACLAFLRPAHGMREDQGMSPGAVKKGSETYSRQIVAAERLEPDDRYRLEERERAMVRRPPSAGGDDGYGSSAAPSLQIAEGTDGQRMGQVEAIDEEGERRLAANDRRQQLEGDGVTALGAGVMLRR